MNVVFVIGSLRGGGAERQVRYLARSMSALGDQVTIAVIERGQHPTAIDAVPVVPLRGVGDSWIKAVARLRVLAGDADVIYSWMDIANVIAVLATIKLPVPLVWGLRSSGMNHGMVARCGFLAARWLSYKAALAISNSQAVQSFYRTAGFSPRGWQVIANGVDTRQFAPSTARPSAADNAVVGMVARAQPYKRYDLFFEMVRLLDERFTGVRWIVAGLGAHASHPEFRQLLDRYGVTDRVQALGEVGDVAEVVAGLDITVCCSDFEGSSNSVLEALSCGVPVVAFPVGDAESMLSNCGIIVRERSAAALAEAVAQLLDDPELRGSLGVAARQRAVSQYSLDALTERTRAILEQTVQCAGSDR